MVIEGVVTEDVIEQAGTTTILAESSLRNP
jgi:hypothetical protein